MKVHVCPSIYVGDSSPSDQGETYASLRSVFRGLYFAALFFLSVSTNRGHTGGGEHWCFWAFFFTSLLHHLLLRCLPHFFHRERGSAAPSVVDNEVEFVEGNL